MATEQKLTIKLLKATIDKMKSDNKPPIEHPYPNEESFTKWVDDIKRQIHDPL